MQYVQRAVGWAQLSFPNYAMPSEGLKISFQIYFLEDTIVGQIVHVLSTTKFGIEGPREITN